MPDDNVIHMRPRPRSVAPIEPATLSRMYGRPARELPKVIRLEPLELHAPKRRIHLTTILGTSVALWAVIIFAAQMVRAYLAGRL